MKCSECYWASVCIPATCPEEPLPLPPDTPKEEDEVEGFES